ncbi:glycosyltransferase family 4 protein [Anabaena azotica]|uniref:glycosyltransferase family 4 protein n=1 Tax=Anabaena azotica TaxID=197653 RepID=UPI0039A763BF
MKIVFVNPVGAIGGAERALLTIMAALLNTKPDMQIYLIAGTDGSLIGQAEKLGVEVKVLKLPEEFNQLGDSALRGNSKVAAGMKLLFQLVSLVPSLWRYINEFRQIIKLLKPDLIHTNGIKANLITALAGVKDIPVIWHIQDFYGARPVVARVLRWASKRATSAIAISQSVAQDAKATLPGLPIEVIYSAIDINYFSPHPSSSHLPLRVGLVATFARWKGHDIFLEAASEIIKNHPHLNVRFCIVGGAIYKTRGSQFSEQELKDKATHLNIADKVDFLGFQQDIAEIYRSLDIVVHASTQPEPFGLAIVEAMACGKPVIVSQAGGAAELFTHNHDAVGVSPGEPKALAAAILDLLNNPEKRQLLSEQARHTVTKRFSHERLGEQILAVYTLLIA